MTWLEARPVAIARGARAACSSRSVTASDISLRSRGVAGGRGARPTKADARQQYLRSIVKTVTPRSHVLLNLAYAGRVCLGDVAERGEGCGESQSALESAVFGRSLREDNAGTGDHRHERRSRKVRVADYGFFGSVRSFVDEAGGESVRFRQTRRASVRASLRRSFRVQAHSPANSKRRVRSTTPPLQTGPPGHARHLAR